MSYHIPQSNQLKTAGLDREPFFPNHVALEAAQFSGLITEAILNRGRMRVFAFAVTHCDWGRSSRAPSGTMTN
jgi:hypothetical protein